MSEDELIKRIEVLKESEARIRAERQELEKQLRDMIHKRLQTRGAEG